MERKEIIGGIEAIMQYEDEYESVYNEMMSLSYDEIKDFIERAKGEIEARVKHYINKGYADDEIQRYIQVEFKPDDRLKVYLRAVVKNQHTESIALSRTLYLAYRNTDYTKKLNEAGLSIKTRYEEVKKEKEEKERKEREERKVKWRDYEIKKSAEIEKKLREMGLEEKAEIYKRYRRKLELEKKFIEEGYRVLKENIEYYRRFEEYQRFIPLSNMEDILNFAEKYNPDGIVIISDYDDPTAVAVFGGDAENRFSAKVIITEW